jgi:hypothetical protein
MPDPPRTDVQRAMMGMNDPNQLEAFAKSLEAQYPIAAWVLRVREAALRGLTPPPQPATPPAPAPVIPVPTVQPIPSQPAPPPPPQVVVPVMPSSPSSPPIQPAPPVTPSTPAVPAIPIMPSAPPLIPGLDAGMSPDVQKAVAGALTTETDPAKLEGFASAIQAQYPIAAGLLSAKAQMLRLAQQPHILPIPPPVPPKPALPPSPSPQVPGSGTTAFPASGTYVVKSGDYPIKITQMFTGNGNRWKELIAANPDKPTRDDGAWKTLFPGEVISLPQSWNKNAAQKAAAALPAAGGTHASHA